ncbi:MAG: tetratricopeptide repeat protein [Planctomycetes bacterium]|nr:tetratricopeptide repeat protein [Planctomycetota bacterium]
MRCSCRSLPRVASLIVLFAALASQAIRAQEWVVYPPADFAKLDTFESLNLEEADKLFAKGDFKGAYAGYKAHSLEFTKSAALPYVILRMGRCLHKLDKRNAAIQAYQEVLDYFPDDVVYAADALYLIGECHGQNGEEAKQTAAWAKLVKDDAYVTQPRSGWALTFLAQRMAALGKFEEATEYQWRTAVAFLKSNPQAAQQARVAVIGHYAVRNPNHDKLKEFYTAASGFDGRGDNVADPENDARYWATALSTALQAPPDDKEKVCRYWVAKVGDKLPDDETVRKLACDLQLGADKDAAAWMARMQKQFARKPATLDRVFLWCEWLRGDPKGMAAFYEKHGQPLAAGLADLGKKMSVMDRLRHLGLGDQALAVLRSARLDGLDDSQIVGLGNFAAFYEPEEAVVRYYARLKDPLTAAKARFDYYNARSDRNPPIMEKALAEVAVLEKSTQHAGPNLTWAKAWLLQRLGRFEEAIKVYREANRQPDSTWQIADCLVAMKQFPQAVNTVKELEAVGGTVASAAAIKAADIHRTAGDKGAEVKQLRSVLKRYPKSGESSLAHNRLEAYGVPLVGGESEAEE